MESASFLEGASLSKDMAEKCKQVHSLWEDGMLQRGLLEVELPKHVEGIRLAKIEYKSSQHEHVEEAMRFLEDPKIKRIGILGIFRTGVEHVVKLQQKIMGSPTDIEVNAQIMFEELKKKKCLILLDEVCHPIELENIIGIHNIQNCKVVLASRDLVICREMDVDKAINVKPLSDDEALNMFKEKRMALEVAAVETIVTEVYRDGQGLLIWSGRKFDYRKNLKGNHEDLMQKARELWELRNGIRKGISQNRIRSDITEWIVKVEMNESGVIELDTKYNDRKITHGNCFILKGASLSKDMTEKCKEVLSLWEEENVKRSVGYGTAKACRGIRPTKIEYKSPLHKHVEATVFF
ncbi:hypothetical protein AAG906_014869 [Vitis piasezkii]